MDTMHATETRFWDFWTKKVSPLQCVNNMVHLMRPAVHAHAQECEQGGPEVVVARHEWVGGRKGQNGPAE